MSKITNDGLTGSGAGR